ncbi:uncharacterized protein [Littorina saxatilis]|uniref:uncharacterized protein n=1 Tax=Littorina saxatilis TaxID=31220 RepID=UPI0038B4C1B5
MAMKREPIDSEAESFFFDSGGRLSRRSPSDNTSMSDVTSQPLNLTSHPVNFLTERGRPEMVVDPMNDDVMFLPPRGRGHRRREVTEYATYTISHTEEELNSKLLPKKYRCRFCVYKTSYKSDLNRHLRKHGIAPQHCPLCNMPFKTTGNLENHMRQAHGDMAASILPTGLCVGEAAAALVNPLALARGVVAFPATAATPDIHQPDLLRHHPGLRPQLQQDFPALSHAVLSPVKLFCHVCPFVCSDSEVLARHLLTHPAEEEVSRNRLQSPEKSDASHVGRRSSQFEATVTRLGCNYCGVVVSSIDELQAHRQSCINPAENQTKEHTSLKSAHSEHLQSSQAKRPTGQRNAEKLGSARQETIEKLRRTITNQAETGSVSGSRCNPDQNKPVARKKMSMVLPHIPLVESTVSETTHRRPDDDSNHEPTSTPLVHMVLSSESSPEPMVIIENDTEEPPLEEDDPQPSKSDCRRTPGADERKQLRDADELKDKNNTDVDSLQNKNGESEIAEDLTRTRELKRMSSDTSNIQDSCHFLHTSAHNLRQLERMTKSARNVDTSPSDQSIEHHVSSQAGHQFSCRTLSIKEEPQSPDSSVEPEPFQYERNPSSRTYQFRSDSPTPQLSNCRRYSERLEVCVLCDQHFRSRIHLIQHLLEAHGLRTRFSHDLNLDFRCRSLGRRPSETEEDEIVRPRLQGRELSKMKPFVAESAQALPVPDSAANRTSQIQTPEYSHSPGVHSAENQLFAQQMYAEFYNPRVLSHPPSSGRYAKLVSDFDEFSLKPYACSLCFFRTARLVELASHANNHLTGGATCPLPETARFGPMESFHVERATSPLRESVTVSSAGSPSPLSVNASDGNGDLPASFDNEREPIALDSPLAADSNGFAGNTSEPMALDSPPAEQSSIPFENAPISLETQGAAELDVAIDNPVALEQKHDDQDCEFEDEPAGNGHEQSLATEEEGGEDDEEVLGDSESRVNSGCFASSKTNISAQISQDGCNPATSCEPRPVDLTSQSEAETSDVPEVRSPGQDGDVTMITMNEDDAEEEVSRHSDDAQDLETACSSREGGNHVANQAQEVRDTASLTDTTVDSPYDVIPPADSDHDQTGSHCLVSNKAPTPLENAEDSLQCEGLETETNACGTDGDSHVSVLTSQRPQDAEENSKADSTDLGQDMAHSSATPFVQESNHSRRKCSVRTARSLKLNRGSVGSSQKMRLRVLSARKRRPWRRSGLAMTTPLDGASSKRCSECGKEFALRLSLVRHVRIVHVNGASTVEPPF